MSARQAFAVLATLAVCTIAMPAVSRADPRPMGPTLEMARSAPQTLRYLKAHTAVTITRQCPRGHYWTELSAYTWRGGRLPAQVRHGGVNSREQWGRVTFDGITWRNHYNHPVLVAGWCS